MSNVQAPQCVESANIRNAPKAEQGPTGGRLQCRSCGSWIGKSHHPGCPLDAPAKLAEAPKPELMAAVEAAPEAAPIGVEAVVAPKPRRKRSPRKKT